jgi:hypothetical protein
LSSSDTAGRSGASGQLVKVAWAQNQAEAELIQGILEGEGIPSMVKRARGFDVPDFLAAGPRDVLVPEEAIQPARELLLREEVLTDPVHTNGGGARGDSTSAGRLLAWLLLATALAAGLVWLLYQATG